MSQYSSTLNSLLLTLFAQYVKALVAEHGLNWVLEHKIFQCFSLAPISLATSSASLTAFDEYVEDFVA